MNERWGVTTASGKYIDFSVAYRLPYEATAYPAGSGVAVIERGDRVPSWATPGRITVGHEVKQVPASETVRGDTVLALGTAGTQALAGELPSVTRIAAEASQELLVSQP